MNYDVHLSFIGFSNQDFFLDLKNENFLNLNFLNTVKLDKFGCFYSSDENYTNPKSI